MLANVSGRLSSDYLYHFKRDPEVVKLILRDGYRHNLLRETLPFRASEQLNFVVCFCDIQWQESHPHRACYGDNAIVLTKRWGVAQGVSPVRYIHETSPGAGRDYIGLKTIFRFLRDASEGNDTALLRAYLTTSLLRDEGLLDPTTIPGVFANDERVKLGEARHDDDVDGLMRRIGHSDAQLVLRYLGSLLGRIIELHNELEFRDSFTRRYQEDFQCPASGDVVTGKVLYDEREWRSIKYGVDVSSPPPPNKLSEWQADGYLPRSFNLRFADDDVVGLVAQDDATKADLSALVARGETLLSRSFNRIYSISEYDEHAR